MFAAHEGRAREAGEVVGAGVDFFELFFVELVGGNFWFVEFGVGVSFFACCVVRTNLLTNIAAV